jgi:putative heme-binding domain-containing protein
MQSWVWRSVAAMAVVLATGGDGRAQLVQDHPGEYSRAEIESGARLYSAQCAQCHGVNGDQVSGVDLRRGPFRRAASDEDLGRIITNGLPGIGMPPFGLQPSEVTAVIAFIRAGFDPAARPVKIGNPDRGRSIAEGKGRCLTCHRIDGAGSRVAPDLSDIGIIRTAEALHRSLVDPDAAMMPINRPVRIVMKDGRTLNGRRLNEDTYTVQMIDDDERLHSIAKDAIASYVVATTSRMPSYVNRLTTEELADVIAFLLTLKSL